MEATNLAPLAINAALNGDWKSAVSYNLKILKLSPQDEETLLRLAKAYEELGEIKLAKRYYRKTIKLDRFNPIAKRGLERLNNLKDNKSKSRQKPKIIDGNFFLEEPGKTKSISLVRLAPPESLLKLNPAQEVKLVLGKRSISVRDKQNTYLGRIPDDLSQRLIKLIKRGNIYSAVIKAAEKKILQIFIREVERSSKNINIPSFLSPGDQYHAFLPKEAINKAD